MPSGGTLDSLGAHFDPIAESAKRATEAVNSLRQDLGGMQTQITQNSQQIASVINTLNNGMEKVSGAINSVAQSMSKYNTTTGQGQVKTKEVAATIDDLWNAYKKMGIEVDALNLDMKTLTFTQSELNKAVKLGNVYNAERSTSYNALSEKYRAMKILYDNMTSAELQNTEAGKKFTIQLKEMYAQMNMLQQSTGKYQLQVGNYSKAMTGLNIATQQVIREMPVLAQSTQMFVMAISNNVPILLDQIKIFQNTQTELKKTKVALEQKAVAAEAAGNAAEAAALKEQAGAIKTMSLIQGLTTTIFSWQTAVVLLLTVLPNVIKKIKEKKNAIAELNEETKTTLTYTEALAEAEKSKIREESKSVTELQTVYKISQDYNRSWQERLDAANALKQMYPEEFAYFDAEAIAMGKAKTSVDELTDALVKQATARAYLSEIERLSIEKQNLIVSRNKTGVTSELLALHNEDYDLQNRASRSEFTEKEYLEEVLPRRVYIGNYLTDTYGKDYEKKIASYISYDAQIQDAENAIKRLQKLISTDVLSDVVSGSGKPKKDDRPKVFTFDWDLAKKEAKEKGYDLSVAYEDIDAEILRNIKIALGQEKEIRDNAIYEDYQTRKEAEENIAKLKNDTQAQLTASEREYWESYLKMLSENGVLTIEEYQKIQAKLYALDSGGTDTSKRKGKGAKFGGVASAFAAYSSTYGDYDQQGYKIVAEKYQKYFTAIDSSINTSISHMEKWMDARVQMAELAVECAEKEMDSAKTLLDYELQARANGYANNVEYAQKEYEEKRKIAQKAAQDALELQRVQEAANTAQQISSLVTATANIWSAEGIKGLAGVPLALAATAAMWLSFGAAKFRAAQLANAQTEQYGEGMSEYLNYGGSHASGNDIDFGVKPDGTRRRVERGEMIGVINKRNVNKYGVKQVGDIISALNKGEFEQRYGNAFSYGFVGGSTDLSQLEKGVNSLVEQGNTRVVNVNGKTIAYYKNTKRVIRS